MNTFLRWILTRCVRPEDRAFLLQDLDDEWSARRVAGDPTADRWYRGQMLRSIWPSLLRRLGRSPSPTSPSPSVRLRPGASFLDILRLELRHALRSWGRNPVVAAATVVTLALGIGVPATMYSIVHGALRDLPVHRGEDVMAVLRVDVRTGVTGLPVTHQDYADWHEQQTTFEDLGAFTRDRVNLSDDMALPERVAAAAITSNAFAILGMTAARGRTFTSADENAANGEVALISDALWQRRFGGDSTIVGRTIRVNGTTREIVGVMPPRFTFPGREHLWTPLAIETEGPRPAQGVLSVFGRLIDGQRLRAARAEFELISQRLATVFPETNADLRVQIVPYTEERFGEEMGPILYTMLGIVSTVLLIACANVANLLTAQAVHRRREFAIRSALGAGRGRLLSQFFVQSASVAIVGAGMGIGIAWAGTRLFNLGMAETVLLYWIDVKVDGATLAFVVASALVASTLSAIIPVRQAWRGDVQPVLQREGRGGSGFRLGRLTGALVVAQVTFSCVLLAVAGLMTKGLTQMGQLTYPFAADHVLVGRIEFAEAEQQDPIRRAQFVNTLRTRLEAEPGITNVAFASAPPGLSLDPWPVALGAEIAATETPSRRARRIAVSPNFFYTLDADVLEGRGFGPGDGVNSDPVAIVNRSFAELYFPGTSALGHQVRFGPGDWGLDTRVIVGVVPDLLAENVSAGRAVPEGVYVPLSQAGLRSPYMLVRTPSDPLAILPTLRNGMAEVDPDLPLAEPQRLDLAIASSVQIFRVFGRLFAVFGLSALFLASVGLHGITSFSVGQRRREIGVRMALGALGRDVTWLVLRDTLRYVAIGSAAGLGLAMVVTPILRDGFLGVGTGDPMVWLTILGTLGGVAMLAAAGPLRRARRVDPMAVLRVE